MIPIMEAASDPRVKRIVVITGSQTSKTESMLNVCGHRLDDDAVPIIYVGPTKSNIDGVIEPRVDKMLRSAPQLWAKTQKGKSAQKYVKRVGGVEWRLAWAGSASELASMPAGLALIDEIDRMGDVKGEGSVLELVEARLSTYPDAKSLIATTPTVGTVEVEPDHGIDRWKVADPDDIGSPGWRLWQEGTRHEWAVGCRHCGEYFIPRFRLLVWPENCGAAKARREAGLACSHCGGIHTEKSKGALNRSGLLIAPGQWVEDGRVKGPAPDPEISTFWISGLMSPWVSFGDRAAAWIRAVRSNDPARIQTQLNTRFGELYATKGEAPEWQDVQKCAANYSSWDIPTWVQRIYLTADVQQDRIPWVLRGWGPGFTSAQIACGDLWGRTDDAGTWDELEQMAERTFGDMPIHAVAVDSGYRTDQVYEFCRRNQRYFATKGQDAPRKMFSASPVEVRRDGKVMSWGLKLWSFDASFFKDWVHARVNWPQDQPGAWMLPSDVTEDYCRQIVAEQKVYLPSGKAQWLKLHRENHFLDCEVLQAFLANMLDVRHLDESGKPKKQDAAKKTGSWLDTPRKRSFW